ncbi:hypothetical protein A6D96_04700 [Vibrio cyclitrophicus]|nr:hypothetical protein A6D96_04700 [Vibrio cyclitrophicus]
MKLTIFYQLMNAVTSRSVNLGQIPFTFRRKLHKPNTIQKASYLKVLPITTQTLIEMFTSRAICVLFAIFAQKGSI